MTNISFAKKFWFGESGIPLGTYITHVPTPQAWDGFQINNTFKSHYTNILNTDAGGTQYFTFRSYYNKLTSLVDHDMSGILTCNGQLNLNNNIYANSTTITPTVISYLSGVSANIQTQLNNINANFNNYLLLTGGTLSGNLTCNSTLTLNNNVIANATTITPTQLSYIYGATSNIQTQLNNINPSNK